MWFRARWNVLFNTIVISVEDMTKVQFVCALRNGSCLGVFIANPLTISQTNLEHLFCLSFGNFKPALLLLPTFTDKLSTFLVRFCLFMCVCQCSSMEISYIIQEICSLCGTEPNLKSTKILQSPTRSCSTSSKPKLPMSTMSNFSTY